MHHQVTIVPGLEGESASKPAQRPAFLVASIESKDNHTGTGKCRWRDASRDSGGREHFPENLVGFRFRHRLLQPTVLRADGPPLVPHNYPEQAPRPERD